MSTLPDNQTQAENIPSQQEIPQDNNDDDAYIIELFKKRCPHLQSSSATSPTTATATEEKPQEKTEQQAPSTGADKSLTSNLESLFSSEDASQYERKDIFFSNLEESDIWYQDSDDELDEVSLLKAASSSVTKDALLSPKQKDSAKDQKKEEDDDEDTLDVTKFNLLKFCQLNNPSLQGDAFSRTAFQDQFKPLFNSQNLSDVVFVAHDATTQEWKKIYAHKLILKTRAKFFRTMFRSGMKEALQEEVKIQSVPYDVLLSLLEYIYTGVLKITYEKALLLLAAANQFQMEDVKQIIAQYFSEIIDAEIACLLYEESFFHNATELRELCLSYIEENSERVVNSNAFQSMTTEMVLEIIKSDYLIIDEFTIFKACIGWAKMQAKLDNVDVDKNYPEYFAKVVPYIRFPRMKALELRDQIEKEYKDLVPREYILEAYKYRALPKSVKSIRARERLSRVSYEWSTTLKSSQIMISNNGTTVKTTASKTCTVCADVTWNSGAHYFEVTIDSTRLPSNIMVGLADSSYADMNNFLSHQSRGWAIYAYGGKKYHNSVSQPYAPPLKKGDVVGVFVDFNTEEVRFFVNGVDMGVAFSNVTGSVSPAVTLHTKHDQVTLNSSARPPNI